MHLVSCSPGSSLQHAGFGHTDEGVEGLLCLSLLSPGVCTTQRPRSEPRSACLGPHSTFAFPLVFKLVLDFRDYSADSDLASLCH